MVNLQEAIEIVTRDYMEPAPIKITPLIPPEVLKAEYIEGKEVYEITIYIGDSTKTLKVDKESGNII